MDVEKTIREYLPDVCHLSLATCASNQPWVCEVHFVYDNELNLYFRSKPSRRHSKEIDTNTCVAGNIIQPHKVGEKVRGVYFEGAAEMLTSIDAESPVYKLFCDRLQEDDAILEETRTEDGHQFYKITVREFVLFDSKDSNPSQKYQLPWKTI